MSNTRSHPELGREKPPRQWYCVLRRGRVGRRQVTQAQETPNTKHIRWHLRTYPKRPGS
ncbi:protein of unknown function (plasmid) [Azospirillum lipoferum 4B]|uniref:Uncharacterized protein n=1 Tax=Azospirillum lipoferum (strain 4B) TaxID=862719 RepID=G7ZHN0_AZOL4|nr:protein of unknown function [Azospirillum lipoferum 4B]